jgi:hypothetical protein
MINVKNKRCNFIGCTKQPIFDVEGGMGKFCAKHKEIGMVDIRHNRCEFQGCKTRPTFDVEGGMGKFCAKHKEVGMINVKNKRCNFQDCTSRPCYGKIGYGATRCAQHKEKGMIIKPNAKCTHCNEQAIWGLHRTPMRCDIHKNDNDENLAERKCISCGLLFILNSEDKCEYCNPIVFKTAYLAKQNALMNYLDTRGLIGMSTDKIVDTGECGKERPDRIYDFDDKIIILECDENQHKQRTCDCEQTRMVNIFNSFGGIPVHFIRWNPDNYKCENGEMEPLSNRHKLCADLIEDIRDNHHKIPEALLSVIYLYYDGWTTFSKEEWIKML